VSLPVSALSWVMSPPPLPPLSASSLPAPPAHTNYRDWWGGGGDELNQLNNKNCLDLLHVMLNSPDYDPLLNPYINVTTNQSWAPDTFSPFRYPIFRYLNACIRFRYSDTFKRFVVRYSIFDIDTFLSTLAQGLGQLLSGFPLKMQIRGFFGL
jgi:hypothetical protein